MTMQCCHTTLLSNGINAISVEKNSDEAGGIRWKYLLSVMAEADGFIYATLVVLH